MSDPRVEALPKTTTLRLTAWGQYLSTGLQILGCKGVRFVPPQFVEMLFLDGLVIKRTEAGERVMSFKDLEEVVRRQDLRVRCLKHWWEHSQVLLIVVRHPHIDRHALLALRKEPTSVRYYEA